jgi:uncharacterized membrane protein YdjX (TVP38/TMEM64 family)
VCDDGAATARLLVLGALLMAGVVLTLTGALPSADTVRGWADQGGPGVAVGFVAAYAAITLLLVPKNVLSAAAGLVFGLTTGSLLVWTGAVLGAAAAFWLGRALGREGVERLAGRPLARLDALVERRGAIAVLVARLVPVVPFTLVNYGSGVTVVGFGRYLVATAVGIVPGTVAYVAVGAYGTEPGTWPFLLAVAVLVALGVGGVVAARRRSADTRDAPEA